MGGLEVRSLDVRRCRCGSVSYCRPSFPEIALPVQHPGTHRLRRGGVSVWRSYEATANDAPRTELNSNSKYGLRTRTLRLNSIDPTLAAIEHPQCGSQCCNRDGDLFGTREDDMGMAVSPAPSDRLIFDSLCRPRKAEHCVQTLLTLAALVSSVQRLFYWYRSAAQPQTTTEREEPRCLLPPSRHFAIPERDRTSNPYSSRPLVDIGPTTTTTTRWIRRVLTRPIVRARAWVTELRDGHAGS